MEILLSRLIQIISCLFLPFLTIALTLLVAEFRHLQNPFPGTGFHCSYRIIWLSTSQPTVIEKTW